MEMIVKPTFEDFIRTPIHVRSAWTKEPGIELYFRKPNPYSHTADFDLPSMNADVPGNGALRNFLDRYSDRYRFYIHGIMEQWLVDVFSRRGYRKVEDGEIFQVTMIHASCKSIYDTDWVRPTESAADLFRR
jgi:hypothetical protein